MILKSFEIEKNIESISKFKFTLIYGENLGLKDKLKSEIIIVTNGLNHFYFKLDKNKNQYIQEKDLISYNK